MKNQYLYIIIIVIILTPRRRRDGWMLLNILFMRSEYGWRWTEIFYSSGPRRRWRFVADGWSKFSVLGTRRERKTDYLTMWRELRAYLSLRSGVSVLFLVTGRRMPRTAGGRGNQDCTKMVWKKKNIKKKKKV